MSHQVQLSPAASHCPTAVLDPAGHATDPPACRSRCPYSPGRTCADTVPPWKSDLHGHLSHPRQRFPGEPGTGTAGPGRAGPPRSAGRPDSREEGSGARTPRATGAPHYVLGHPGSDLLARLVAAVNLRATPRGTCHRPPVDRLRHQGRPAPTTTSAHPILPMSESAESWSRAVERAPWTSCATTVTDPARWHSGSSCKSCIGPTWTDTRRRWSLGARPSPTMAKRPRAACTLSGFPARPPRGRLPSTSPTIRPGVPRRSAAAMAQRPWTHDVGLPRRPRRRESVPRAGLRCQTGGDLDPPPDRNDLIAYGPLLSDAGDTWLGTAALVHSPDPRTARALLTQERYVNIEVHNWQFGGRP